MLEPIDFQTNKPISWCRFSVIKRRHNVAHTICEFINILAITWKQKSR